MDQAGTAQNHATNNTLQSTESLQILLWNVEYLSTLLHDDTSWTMIDEFDVIFLIETHHTYVPMKAGWRVHGEERQPGSSAGGILVLIRDGCPVATSAPDFLFDGFV